MAMRYNAHVTATLNFDTLVAGSVVGGNAVDIGDNTNQKVRSLSALVVVEAETNGITFTGKWQVSNDGTTWVDIANGTQNAAGVALATGTAGDDAVVTRAYPAPDAVYGWRKARFAITNGSQTGAVTDTYKIGYCYRAGA
jgi:hypothetical protein